MAVVVSALLAAAGDDPARNVKGLICGLVVAVAAIALFTGGSNRNGR